jgi:hypothetical protein
MENVANTAMNDSSVNARKASDKDMKKLSLVLVQANAKWAITEVLIYELQLKSTAQHALEMTHVELTTSVMLEPAPAN